MPFLSVLARPELVQDSPYISYVYDQLGFKSANQFTVVLGVASIVVVIGSSIFKTVTQYLLNRFVYRQRHLISSRLLSRYIEQPYEFFLERNSSELSKNVLSEVDQLVFDVLQPMSNMVAQGAIVLAMAVLVFLYDPFVAACIILVLIVLYGSIYRIVREKLVQIGRERRAANGARYQACNEVFSGIRDVKITNSSAAYKANFDRSSQLFSRCSATNETLNQSPLYIVETIGYSGLILIAVMLLLRSDGVADVLPALGLYGFASYRMLPAAQVIYRGMARLKFSSASLDAICHDMQLYCEENKQSLRPIGLKDEIVLNNVTYAYPLAQNRPIFDGYSVSIKAKTTVVIRGKSGAGKSTLMDLLMGLLGPQKGNLIVDGICIDSKNSPSWQRSIGYVPQHIFLSDATILENIAFGVPQDKVDLDAVERAAKLAQIHDFIMNDLSLGYHTFVGDRGFRLSGGQRQRIGIARALYHDPEVIFFDEATSALDNVTENAFLEVLNNLHGKKTIVKISHTKEHFIYDRLIDVSSC